MPVAELATPPSVPRFLHGPAAVKKGLCITAAIGASHNLPKIVDAKRFT